MAIPTAQPMSAPQSPLLEPIPLPSGSADAPFAGAQWWRQLARVGPLLWQFCGDDPLAPVREAHCCEARARLGNDGLLEWLWFDGAAGNGALYLLPESDYLAWDWLLARAVRPAAARTGTPERGCLALLRRRLWQRRPWRFEVLSCAPPSPGQAPRWQPASALSIPGAKLVERVRRQHA